MEVLSGLAAAPVIQFGYFVSAIAFLVLAGLAMLSRTPSRQKNLLVLSAFLTSVWSAGVYVSTIWDLSSGSTILLTLEVARSLSWIALLIVLAGLTRARDRSLTSVVALCIVGAMIAIYGSLVALKVSPDWFASDTFFLFAGAGRMILAIAGLLLLENLYRNASDDTRWAIKYFCFGLGLCFTYDFFFYAESILFKRFDLVLYGARGFIMMLTVPLISWSAARAREWRFDLHVSREIVFHTGALIGAGAYLIAMATVGYYLSQIGGEAGSIFQTTFLFLAAAVLIIIFSSGSVRANARLFIARNFYSVKYDYRQEWLKFIGSLSAERSGLTLHHRMLTAIADIVESTAGVLWVHEEETATFRPMASWNFGDDIPALNKDELLLKTIADQGDIIEVNTQMSPDDIEKTIPLALITKRPVWLIIPMVHRDYLYGLIVLGESRARRSLDGEDRALLNTVSRQAASYIAEDQAVNALAEAKGLEAFNQRFAFVAHDLKNVVNQLSIMVQNTERHGDNPDFQKDMTHTITNAVTRMKSLLFDLSAHEYISGEAPKTQRQFSLTQIVEKLVAQRADIGPEIKLRGNNVAINIIGDPDGFSSSMTHLIQNAADASGPEGSVEVLIDVRDQHAVVEVVDNGPGMARDFVENKLFRPFVTTKKDGFGIGVYQIRQQIRDMKGRLEVESIVGTGTTMRITLPLMNPSDKTVGKTIAQEIVR